MIQKWQRRVFFKNSVECSVQNVMSLSILIVAEEMCVNAMFVNERGKEFNSQSLVIASM